MTETLVREADEADLAAAVDVLRAANAEFADVLPAAVFQVFIRNSLDVRSRLADATLLVAERDGHIVGTMTYYPDASLEGWGWPAHWAGLRAVGVHPSARGQGVASQMVQECIGRARAQGTEALCLHTGDFMHAAMAMYERNGFQRLPGYDRDVLSLFVPDWNATEMMALGYWLDLATA